ncbi:MAG TPA: disulfide oxidoreductase [Thermoanaerobaculia bacterium]|nr:disulfide oxidoreductase [Thermoanaerobaculia bacterium]
MPETSIIPEPAATTGTRPFHPEMTVGQAMTLHPNARWVFASYHLGGCSHCAISEEETISQVAEGYGVPLDKLVDDLNSLITE